MKQDLWIVNSSLLLVCVVILGAYSAFDPVAPVWKTPRLSSVEALEANTQENISTNNISWEKIYQDDIFGTYAVREATAVKQSLVTPIPEPRIPTIPPPPEIKKQEFIPALAIALKGIIAGGDEDRNVAMIADETNKEGMYHLGEKIKDAQIIKIAHNRVVLLRANGQQETFYLRKDDVPFEIPPADKWKYIVKKITDQQYQVDPVAFTKEIESLGNFIERASIIGTVFHDGKPVGIRVGSIDANDIAAAIGLVENDIITTINDVDLGDAEKRLGAYEAITKMTIGGIINVRIKRAEKDVVITYTLITIDKPRKALFPGVRYANEKPTQEETMKMSRLQQREQTVREFQNQHYDNQKHQQTMMDIRRRILEGLQNRVQAQAQN
jgi:type II secretion system protein C